MIGYFEKCMRCTNKYPLRNLIRKLMNRAKYGKLEKQLTKAKQWGN
jgi:hypothetical protein